MTVVKILRPPVEMPPLVKCVGVLKHYPYVNDAYKQRRAESIGVDDGTCGRRSAVVIDEKPYCMVHGAQAALAYLIKLQDEGKI